jgi:threonine synthase
LFTAVAVGREETLAAMAEAKDNYDYILDPHTAVGYAAIKVQVGGLSAPRICIATAHPAKFPDAVIEATGITPTHPSLEALSGLPVRKGHIDANIEAVKEYLAARV